MAVGNSNDGTSGETGTTSAQAHIWKISESDEPTTELERRETEDKQRKNV
jgi:hypothetical protein